MKFYLAQINTIVGDLDGNLEKILREYKKAEEQLCDLIIFPEMTITGYPAEDLWKKISFVKEANKKILEILSITKDKKCAVLVGCPSVSINKAKKEVIYNSAFLIENGEVKQIINKKVLPNYGVFDEKRYFEASNTLSYVEFRGKMIAILICEDLWSPANLYLLQEQFFDFIITINSSPYSIGKAQARRQTIANIAKQIRKPFIYVNQVGGQDAIVFDGDSFVMNEEGQEVVALSGFEEFGKIFDSEKKYEALAPQNSDPLKSIYSACVLGLRDYVQKNGFSKVMLGLSGGIDSALVAVMAVDALGSENVGVYALPSKFNSKTSMDDALDLAQKLGLKLEVISIERTFNTMLETLRDQRVSDLAKENMQSRIRGNLLMAISNSNGALLLSTGNKSEMATGYATIYGDMCGAFNPLKDIYKTQVFALAKWRNQNIAMISRYKKDELIANNIINKAPSAELREGQKDSDSLPEYDILDKILFGLIEEEKSILELKNQGFDENIVKKVAKLMHLSEYKRKQAVIGPKISTMSFDKDRRYPITNKYHSF